MRSRLAKMVKSVVTWDFDLTQLCPRIQDTPILAKFTWGDRNLDKLWDFGAPIFNQIQLILLFMQRALPACILQVSVTKVATHLLLSL
jgi:hypothetical protein